ncbi:MAG: hypothetical protein HZB51_26470 [Chloroflexi bacterium]|nr:hypothetical protein [Chloroflexota bacterium]
MKTENDDALMQPQDDAVELDCMANASIAIQDHVNALLGALVNLILAQECISNNLGESGD